jgi:hypothetical protein
MSCCGSQRAQVHPAPRNLPRPDDRQSQPMAQLTIRFEYVGATGMTAVGPVTGKRYRFQDHGSRVAVDLRDAPSMAGVPHLRRV